MIPVIICGGVGTKMWPMSTPNTPKHFLPLVNDESLFQINWRVLRKWFKPEEIYIQTNPLQAKLAHYQVSEIVAENIFIEPETRNQGPATGLIAANLIKLGKGDEPFMIIQVDDLRLPEGSLIGFLNIAEKYINSTGKYVTSGFEPKWHQSGVDYLLKGELVAEEGGVKIFEVADFVDRSEVDRIKNLMGSGKLLLHTNHSSMTPNGMLSMFKKYRTEWYEPLMAIANGGDVNSEFVKMPKDQIEVVTRLSHKDGRSLVIENNFEWVDFGTWEAVSKFYGEQKITPGVGGTLQIEGKDNFLWSKSGKTIATIGLSDIVVIESEEGILVSIKEMSGQTTKVVEKINSGDL